MRTLTLELVPDVSAFNPHQLKPFYVLASCFNGSEVWARAHGVPHQMAIRNLQTAFVIQVARVQYLQRYTYEQAERLVVSVTRRSLKDGAQVEARTVFDAKPGGTVAEASLCVVPLTLVGDGGELAGLPAPMSTSYLQYFEASERTSESYASPFPSALQQIVESGELVSTYQHPFFVHREHCEFVDQWYFAEASNYAAASRERMVFEQGAKLPYLRRGLSLPMRELSLLFLRPFYFFDEGQVQTRAFRSHEGVCFVHELMKKDVPEPHALVIERF